MNNSLVAGFFWIKASSAPIWIGAVAKFPYVKTGIICNKMLKYWRFTFLDRQTDQQTKWQINRQTNRPTDQPINAPPNRRGKWRKLFVGAYRLSSVILYTNIVNRNSTMGMGPQWDFLFSTNLILTCFRFQLSLLGPYLTLENCKILSYKNSIIPYCRFVLWNPIWFDCIGVKVEIGL